MKEEKFRFDSRMKGTNFRPVITHATLPLERTYCLNCGKPKGWVSLDTYEFIKLANVIVICDDCDEKLGKLPLEEVDIKEL